MQSSLALPAGSEGAAARSALARDPRGVVLRFKAMACEAEIRLDGVFAAEADALLELAASEVRRIEAKYSRYRPDSVVSRVNAAAGSGTPVAIDGETADLLGFAGHLFRLSGGLFDITSGVLRRAWDFRSNRLPQPEAIAALLPRVGWPGVRRDSVDGQPCVELTLAGMELDFGGFGKEYAADRAAAVLQAAGVPGGYVNLGGDIRVIGPRSAGGGWMLGIQHPRQTDATVAGIAMEHGALATSGDYERYMELDGTRYCHILNPRTGWPVQHWQSVSVAAPVCLGAGAITTIAMLMEGQGLEFLRSQQSAYLAIDPQGRIHRQGL